MPASKRLRTLTREIETLRKQFLPSQFDPLGQYAEFARVQAHTRAFLVLSHAEVESYLEGWAKEIARASEVVWASTAKMSAPLTYLVATLASRVVVSDTLQGKKDTPTNFSDTATKLFQGYYKRINDNNGIKERNFLRLFSPLGIPGTVLGTTLLPNLDTLGAIRGTHAHQSAKAVPSVLDPETEYKRVGALLTDLAPVDQWLVDYKRRIR